MKKNAKSDIQSTEAALAYNALDHQGFLVDATEQKRYLSELKSIKRKFAIIRYWPGQPAAEHESVERFKLAAQQLGLEVIEVDKNGYVLDGMKRKITPDEVDFVLNLHFEAQKRFDCFSISALWNPIRFYYDWGYEAYINNQFSHDGYLTCNSAPINTLMDLELPNQDYFSAVVNHTLTGPLYAPTMRDDRVAFYAGINWEKINQRKGRFEDILVELDRKKKIAICGPEKIQGINVWDGYNGYKGSVPFDGVSILKNIHQAGICLVLSSDAHAESEIMSSRLFECAASGAVAIANKNRFIDKYFPNCVNIIDSDSPNAASDVLDLIDDINRKPEYYCNQAKALQELFVKNCLLQNQIFNLYAELPKYKDNRTAKIATNTASIAVIIFDDELNREKLERLLETLSIQSSRNFNVYILNKTSAGKNTNTLKSKDYTDLLARKFSLNIKILPIETNIGVKTKNTGAILSEVFEAVKDDYLVVLRGYEELYSDFIAKINMSILNNVDSDVHVLSFNNKHYDGILGMLNAEYFYNFVRSSNAKDKDKLYISSFVFSRSFFEKNKFLSFLNYSYFKELLNPLLYNVAYVETPVFDVDVKCIEVKPFEADDVVYDQAKQIYVLSKYLNTVKHKFALFDDAIRVGSLVSSLALEDGNKSKIFVKEIIREQGTSPTNIMNWSAHDKRRLAVDLIKALPIPKPLFTMARWCVRLYMKIRHR